MSTCVALFSVVFLVASGMEVLPEVSVPNLHWSMNEVFGVVLYPDIGNRTRWFSNLNVSGYQPEITSNFSSTSSAVIVEGINGNALLLSNFSLRVGIPFNYGCLFDLNLCEQGITVAMWMFVESFSGELTTTVFASSRWIFHGAGIALYADPFDGISFKAEAILPNGKTYFAAFERALIEMQWSHVTMTWSVENGIKLFLNGSEATYTQGPDMEINISFHFLEQLRFGDSNTNVTIDEVRLWYKELEANEVLENVRLGSEEAANVSDETVRFNLTSMAPGADNATGHHVWTQSIESSTAISKKTFTGEIEENTYTSSTYVVQEINTHEYANPLSTKLSNNETFITATTHGEANHQQQLSTIVQATFSEPLALYFWTTETIVAVTLGIVLSTIAILLSINVFCCLICKQRRKKKKRLNT